MPLDNLRKLIDGFKSFDPKAEYVAIIDSNKERLVELQQEQLAAGIDVSGSKRSDNYAPLTIFLKNKFGQGLGAVTDRVTFFMKGDLYGSLTATVGSDAFKITSPLFTFDKMIERVGDENFGLDFDQRNEFAINTAMPSYRARWEAVTGTKMKVV